MSKNNHMIGHVHHKARGNPCTYMILQDETCSRFLHGSEEYIKHLHGPEEEPEPAPRIARSWDIGGPPNLSRNDTIFSDDDGINDLWKELIKKVEAAIRVDERKKTIRAIIRSMTPDE